MHVAIAMAVTGVVAFGAGVVFSKKVLMDVTAVQARITLMEQNVMQHLTNELNALKGKL